MDFEIIHAERSVASSKDKNGAKIHSKLTTDYYNHVNVNSPDKFEIINASISKMDDELTVNYEKFFISFLENTKLFLSMRNLKIVSNLKAKEIVKDSSEVVYGDIDNRLPEHLNGLGHMNILFLLLSIEIKKEAFKTNNKDIKLLLIEEPEAHTHPQIQYIFLKKLKAY
ncbi:MAG: AAA family ATPase [Anaeroplasma sp.]